ncbi:TniQ family protein (plasmid) [Rhodococcus pyridinivorans]|uniref:TniQ family protein n=1 Tax=Rhodococcus pyridinivorans TaxID=103816 RepID=UPI001FFE7E74|nr:TniQ family protein [Rhodococcus pyridinivorans]UPK66464.1 TniQ family protein [Rhodococcus pyridinivorans]
MRSHRGEYLPGWLMRVGLRYQLSPLQILRQLAVVQRPVAYHRLLDYVSGHQRRIVAYLGVPADDLFAALQGTPIDAAAARYLAYHCRTRPEPAGSRYCPRCLAEPDTWWRADWANPLLPICLRHQEYLHAECLGCGRMPWTAATWMGTLAAPWQCPQRRPLDPTGPGYVRLPCRHDLRDVPALAAPEKWRTAQQDLIELADLADRRPNRQLRYGTTEIPIIEALDQLCQRFVHTLGHSLETKEQSEAL